MRHGKALQCTWGDMVKRVPPDYVLLVSVVLSPRENIYNCISLAVVIVPFLLRLNQIRRGLVCRNEGV